MADQMCNGCQSPFSYCICPCKGCSAPKTLCICEVQSLDEDEYTQLPPRLHQLMGIPFPSPNDDKAKEKSKVDGLVTARILAAANVPEDMKAAHDHLNNLMTKAEGQGLKYLCRGCAKVLTKSQSKHIWALEPLTVQVIAEERQRRWQIWCNECFQKK